jgi:nicotinate-nucleotide--dimethylbenzimidazole phosphoribosyltransferase
MTVTGLPFDDFRALLRDLPGPDTAALVAARERDRQLTKPAGALGRLEEIAFWLAAWTGRPPAVTRPLVAIFAGNHGVTKHGITPYPSSVTQQMVENFAAGGAAINQICATYDLGLKIFDLALDYPTGDITCEAALSERDCAATMAFGMEAIAGGTDLLCIGEMGIGNTTIAAAINLALYGGTAEEWVGPGTGSEGDVLKRKIDAVKTAVEFHKDHLGDPLEILRRLGGREIAAMAGAILACRMQKIPVLIDGYVATSAAAILKAVNPSALDHCLIGHVSGEPGHLKAIEKLGKTPLLALGMRRGHRCRRAGIVRRRRLPFRHGDLPNARYPRSRWLTPRATRKRGKAGRRSKEDGTPISSRRSPSRLSPADRRAAFHTSCWRWSSALRVRFVGATLGGVTFIILMLVLFCIEAVNTAIEVVDRISPEISTVGRNAKDLGSFAVFCLLVANGLYAGYIVFFAA